MDEVDCEELLDDVVEDEAVLEVLDDAELVVLELVEDVELEDFDEVLFLEPVLDEVLDEVLGDAIFISWESPILESISATSASSIAPEENETQSSSTAPSDTTSSTLKFLLSLALRLPYITEHPDAKVNTIAIVRMTINILNIAFIKITFSNVFARSTNSIISCCRFVKINL